MCAALGQERRPVVGPAVGVPDPVGQLVLDEVGPEAQHLVQDGARHRPEAMRRHPVRRDVQGPERPPKGGVAHRPVALPIARIREHVAVVPRHGMQLAKDLDRLTRQWDHMRRVGLGRRVAPLGSIEVDVGPLGRVQMV